MGEIENQNSQDLNMELMIILSKPFEPEELYLRIKNLLNLI